jgi:hypothetical protein
MRRLALLPNGSAWMSELRNYRLELVDTSGTIRDAFGIYTAALGRPIVTAEQAEAVRQAVKSGKLRDITNDLLARPDRLLMAPSPEIAGLSIDDRTGYLLVALHVPAAGWRDIEVSYDSVPGEVVESHVLLPRKYDTLIHVLDTGRRRMVMSQVLPGYWIVVRSGILGRLSFTDGGYIAIDIVRIALET